MLLKFFKKLLRMSHHLSTYYVNLKTAKAKIERLLSEHGSALDRYGFVQGTDKSSIMAEYSDVMAGHDYLRHYDFAFQSFRAEKFSLVEFGCAGGASLRTWEKYFPDAEIYGVDIDDGAKVHENGRVHIVIGDATKQATYDEIKREINSAFIILDDASHAWSDQRRSFELFWDMIEPGGFYVIEDLVCGTTGTFRPAILDSQPFFEYMHDRSKILRWAADENPELNTYHFEDLPPQIQKIEREMDMCMFVPGAIIVRKKP